MADDTVLLVSISYGERMTQESWPGEYHLLKESSEKICILQGDQSN